MAEPLNSAAQDAATHEAAEELRTVARWARAISERLGLEAAEQWERTAACPLHENLQIA